MNKEFVPYEIALAMKELGFDEPCFGFWSKIHGLFITTTSGKLNENAGEALAPLYQQAFRWFREKGYHCGIIPRYDEFHYFIKDFVNNKEYDDVYNISSYEEAELACLRKLIEIVKEN